MTELELLTKLANLVQINKRRAADASFQLGELAYNRIDYAKAYEHYSDAARLQPENQVCLDMVRKLAKLTVNKV